jgi:hypothetical protein
MGPPKVKNEKRRAPRDPPPLAGLASLCFYRASLRASKPPATRSAPAPSANSDAVPLPPVLGNSFFSSAFFASAFRAGGDGGGAGAGGGGGAGAAFGAGGGGGAGAALGGGGGVVLGAAAAEAA